MKFNVQRDAGPPRCIFRCSTGMRNTMLVILLSTVSMSLAAESGPQPTAVLEVGVAPFLPARTLVQNYQPMRAYLEQHLKQPVMFVTAHDYKTFYERTRRREYPVIITIASAAFLASVEAGYVPMLRPVVYTCPVLVVSRNSNLVRVQDLRGKTVALPDSLAIISMQGMQILRESGFDLDKDVNIRHLSNHSAAVNHVISGEAAAAIVSDHALLQMPAVTQQSVRIVQKWKKAAQPGVVYFANPSLSLQQVAQLTATILEFTRDTPEGREFINKLGYGGLVPATKQDIDPLASYGEMFKEAIISSSEESE